MIFAIICLLKNSTIWKCRSMQPPWARLVCTFDIVSGCSILQLHQAFTSLYRVISHHLHALCLVYEHVPLTNPNFPIRIKFPHISIIHLLIGVNSIVTFTITMHIVVNYLPLNLFSSQWSVRLIAFLLWSYYIISILRVRGCPLPTLPFIFLNNRFLSFLTCHIHNRYIKWI